MRSLVPVRATPAGGRGSRRAAWCAAAALAAALGCGRAAPPAPPAPAAPTVPADLPADYEAFRGPGNAFRPTGDRTLDYWAEVNIALLCWDRNLAMPVAAGERVARDGYMYGILAESVRGVAGEGADPDVRAWAGRVAAAADGVAAVLDPGARVAANAADTAAARGGRTGTAHEGLAAAGRDAFRTWNAAAEEGVRLRQKLAERHGKPYPACRTWTYGG